MQKNIIEIYRGYELIEFISNANDIIYNAVSTDLDSFKITCTAYNLEELKQKVDKVWLKISLYKKLEQVRRDKYKFRLEYE